MDSRSPSYEASLLYEVPGASDPAMLAHEARDIARQHGLTPRSTLATDGIFQHIDCGAVHLLLAFCPDPLPAGHFLEAGRPLASTTDEQVILRKLNRQTAHLTILVMDSPDPRPDTALLTMAAKCSLCRDIADCLTELTDPDFVFWADNDTLYTAGEFSRHCHYLGAQQTPAGAAPILRHVHLRTDPELAPEAEDWLAMEPQAATPDPEDDATLDQAIADLVRKNLALGLAVPKVAFNTQRALRSITMACCGATIGLSSGLGGFF